jgi:hypothetical protein
MTKFHLQLNGFLRGTLSVAAFGCVIVAAGQSSAAEGNWKSACQFDSLHERTKNNPFSRAAYTALQWVEYEDKVLQVGERAKEMMSVPRIPQAQFVTITLSSWSAIAKLSSTHPLHKCFEETFTSDETLDTYFSGIVFVKGRLAKDAPYAMVIPRNSSDLGVLILPTSMYRFQRSTGSLQAFDNESQAYVDVDPRARRGIDHIIQSNLAKLKN